MTFDMDFKFIGTLTDGGKYIIPISKKEYSIVELEDIYLITVK